MLSLGDRSPATKPDVRPRAGSDVRTAARWQASEYRKPARLLALLHACLPACLPACPLACLLACLACLFACYANNFRPSPALFGTLTTQGTDHFSRASSSPLVLFIVTTIIIYIVALLLLLLRYQLGMAVFREGLKRERGRYVCIYLIVTWTFRTFPHGYFECLVNRMYKYAYGLNEERDRKREKERMGTDTFRLISGLDRRHARSRLYENNGASAVSRTVSYGAPFPRFFRGEKSVRAGYLFTLTGVYA